MIIFAAGKKRTIWIRTEWTLNAATLQQDVGQHMDIYRALATLKEMERTCITLFYMEDQSIEKITGITGCPAGTVKSHLSRAKDKMASYLKQNGYDGK